MVLVNEGLLKLYRRILNEMIQSFQNLNTEMRNHSDNNRNNNKPLMIVGPSAVGKHSLLNKLKEKYPDIIYNIPLYTSRPKRTNEIEGADYFFITKEEFLEKKNRNDLFGVQEYNNEYYALSRNKLKEAAGNNKIIIMSNNIITANEIKNELDFNYVAILPPCEGELRNRLINRGINKEEVEKMMSKSIKEIQLINEANYIKFRFVNDNEERVINKLEKHLKDVYSHLF